MIKQIKSIQKYLILTNVVFNIKNVLIMLYNNNYKLMVLIDQ